MSTDTSQGPLPELLWKLEAAVRAGDRDRALELEQVILQSMAENAAYAAELERRVRDLMAKLDETLFQHEAVTVDPLSLERGIGLPGSVNVEGLPPSGKKGVVYPVWFGTNRKPDETRNGFTSQRHDRITHGRANVFVPEAHRFGEIGNSFWERLRRRDLRDDHLRLQQVEVFESNSFFAEIQHAMQDARDSGAQPHALFFLHGFNVSFEEAAIRSAQLGVDLGVQGATAFFSWPSRGGVRFYPADEATIEASERTITDFLVDFHANCGAEKVHVIAHSMGNRGLLRALQRIAGNAQTRGKVKFGQIFLAAPDVDRDLFLDLASLYAAHSERTTLYTSDGDLPLHLSRKLHDAPRAGYFIPYTVAPDLDTVAVPDFDIDLLGHSYFAKAEPLLYDIRALMHHDEKPASRQRIERAEYDGTSFWQLKR